MQNIEQEIKHLLHYNMFYRPYFRKVFGEDYTFKNAKEGGRRIERPPGLEDSGIQNIQSSYLLFWEDLQLC